MRFQFSFTSGIIMRHFFWLCLLAPAAGICQEPPVKPLLLELKPIPMQRLDKLSQAARDEYQAGMTEIDRINYKGALEHFMKAVEAEPDDVYLRNIVVQMGQYMGASRAGAESIRYYDIAAQNLKEMVDSPKLNLREKERAQKALETIVSLRQTVGERDEKRQQAGMEIAREYAAQVYKDTEDKNLRDVDRQKKLERIQALYQQTLGGGSTGFIGGMGTYSDQYGERYGSNRQTTRYSTRTGSTRGGLRTGSGQYNYR
jgi:hypothetical protein